MISAIKEICIFMIIAQAILFFVPGSSYGKYVRLLVGVMLILRITEPLFGLVLNEEKQLEIRERVSQLEQAIHMESKEPAWEDSEAIVNRGIEEELKNKLEKCEGGYQIAGVNLEQGTENLIITVIEKNRAEGEIRIEPVKVEAGEEKKREEGGEEEQELKRLYGSTLGMEPEKIKIVWER